MKHEYSPSSAPANRRRWRMPLLVVLISSLAVGGWMLGKNPATASQSAPAKSAENKEKKNEVLELGASDSARIALQELQQNLPVTGNLVPVAQATIKSKVSGTVQQALVQEGMVVQAGQVLAKLDGADLQARVATQQAAVDEAQARLALAKKNSANNQALLKQNYISQNAYDTSQNSVDLALAALRSAQAQLEIARIAANDTVIRAPMSGIISKRYLQSGDKASPDMPMFTIVNLSKMTLEAQVPTSEIARVKTGHKVQFMVEGFAQRQFEGVVERINPSADASSRSLTAYVQVENTDLALKGGMYAKGRILLEKSSPQPQLPLIALRSEGGNDVVYKINDGKVVAQKVKLGLRNEEAGMAEVKEGLQAGDEVLVTKLDNVKPGSLVKVAKPAPAQKG